MAMLLSVLLLQAAANPAPDIELNVHIRAKSVEIERKGEARLEVRAEPDGGSRVQSDVRPASKGATSLKNVEIDIHAEASVTDSPQIRIDAETSAPQ
jgi:hypothetical protein